MLGWQNFIGWLDDQRREVVTDTFIVCSPGAQGEHKMLTWKVEAEGDTVYVQANTLDQAEAKFENAFGVIPKKCDEGEEHCPLGHCQKPSAYLEPKPIWGHDAKAPDREGAEMTGMTWGLL
jgi:hypothetical protein